MIIYNNAPVTDDFTLPWNIIKRAVYYGDGCFETLRLDSGQFIFLRNHLDRLASNLEMMKLDYPKWLNEDRLNELISELGLKIDDKIQIGRIQVFREDKRGYRVSKSSKTHSLFEVIDYDELVKPINLQISKTVKTPTQSLPSSIKSSNGLNYILPLLNLSEDFDDILLTNYNGFISETTHANIFWKKGDTWFTPNLKSDCLPGITRKAFIRFLSHKKNYNVKEILADKVDILNADHCYMTNSVHLLSSVGKINTTLIEVDFEFELLKSEFLNYLKNQ